MVSASWENTDMLRILVVGQIPPPYHGQALMIEKLLAGKYSGIQLYHVRMRFSERISEVGRFRLVKVVRMISLVLRIALMRLRAKTTVLYYPPAGPDLVPMYRDLFVLIATRWLFKKTVFHFHAGGISALYADLNGWLKPLFRLAFFNADLGLRASLLAPRDPEGLRVRHEVIIPFGIEDNAVRLGVAHRRILEAPPATILFVGVLRESKGILVLLEAARQLLSAGLEFRIDLVGEFESSTFQTSVLETIRGAGLSDRVRQLGMLEGDAKWTCYAHSDIFCFPTFYETFGVVLLEAMQFGLPIVSTRWSGADLVEDGINGFLVPIHDAGATADRLAQLVRDPALARAMGLRGRRKYENGFTLPIFYRNAERAFNLLRGDHDSYGRLLDSGPRLPT